MQYVIKDIRVHILNATQHFGSFCRAFVPRECSLVSYIQCVRMAGVESEKSPELKVVKRHGAKLVSLSEAAPTSLVEKKNRIYEAAKGNDGLLKLIVLLWGVLLVLILVCFISYVWYTLSQTDSRDTNLEEKILTGDKVESLRALKQQSLETTSTTYNMVLGFVVVAMLTGFGGVLFYVFFSERSRRHEVVKTATDVADIQQENITLLSDELIVKEAAVSELETKIEEHREKDVKSEEQMEALKREKSKEVAELQATARMVAETVHEQKEMIAQLTADRNRQSEEIRGLEAGVKQYEAMIEQHRQKDERNDEEIKRLEKLKADKMAELDATNAALQSTQKRLEEAKGRGKTLEDEVRKKDRSNRKLQHDLESKEADITTLQADLRREKGAASSHKERIERLEAEKEELTTEKHQLEATKDELETEKDELEAEKEQLVTEKQQLQTGQEKIKTEKAKLQKEKADLEREKEKIKKEYQDFINKPWYSRAWGK